MTFEKLLAFENDLTREDREAIDALALDEAGLDLIDRVLSSQRSTGESVRRARRDGVSGVGRSSNWTHSTDEHSPSKGAKIMKSLVLSLLVVSGLTGAIVLGTRGDGRPAGGAAFDQEAAFDQKMDLLVNRLESIEQRLGNLDKLENRLDRLASLAAVEAPSRDAAVAYGSAEERAERVKGDRAARNDDDLRDYIVRVMDDVRDQKIAEQRRLAEERQRELMALHEGPYEGHNYRVNTMAKRLVLSDRQKQHYYLNLAEYNQMIERSRENESQDKENRQQYRDERKRIRSEFSQVVLSSLSPEQAETFSSLPSNEQRPDGSYRYLTTSTIQLAPGMIPPAGEPVSNVVIGEAPVTGFFEGAGTIEVEVLDRRVAAQKAMAEAQSKAAEIEALRALELEAKANKAAQEAQSDK